MPKSAASTVNRPDSRVGDAVDTAAGGRPTNKERVTGNAARRLSGLVHAGNRPPSVVSFDDAVVSFFVDAADMLGVPKSVAAIYGICFASPQPLSFSDIDDRLEISSGSISQGLRVLREVGALKMAEPAKAAPSERDRRSNLKADTLTAETDLKDLQDAKRSAVRYEPDLELRKLVLHWIERRLQGQLTVGRSRLQEICDTIPPTSNPALETLKMRFESLQTWQDKAHALLPIAKTFLKL